MSRTKPIDRLNNIKRREAWLRSQVESTPDRTDISYTRQEAAALAWAIPILEAHIAELKGDN